MLGALKSIFTALMGGASASPVELKAASELVESLLAPGAHKVVVFSKSYCPYCIRAQSLLKQLGQTPATMKVLELDQMGTGGAIQAYLAQRVGAGRVTVPQIYVNSTLVGGCSQLEALQQQGKLADLLK